MTALVARLREAHERQTLTGLGLRLRFRRWPQISRYAAVSILALTVDYTAYLMLVGAGMKPMLAAVLGYPLGLMLHFALSTTFVFDISELDKARIRLFGEFVLSGLAGLAATTLVVAAATEIAGLHALPAKVMATGVSFLIVYSLRRAVVFSARRVQPARILERALAFCRLVLAHVRGRLREAFDWINRRAVAPDVYVKLTVGGGVFFAVLEISYFLFSDPPSFWKPTLDAFGNTAIGRDFLNAWIGGWAALGEGSAAWFDHRVYNDFLLKYIGVADMHRYVWSYPPHVLLFLWPLGLLPYLPAFALWTVGGFAVFLWAVRAGGVEREHLLFVAVAPAVAINVFIGQNGFFTAALLIAGLANLDRRPVLSGVLFGILTIKPQLGLLLPLMLLVTGRWRVIGAAALTTVALVGATAWLWGPGIWAEFLAKVVPQQRFLQEHGDGLLFLQIPSAIYAARNLGLPLNVAWAVQLLVSTLALAVVVWAYSRRRDRVLTTSLLIVAIFLVSPYTLNYDMVIFGWVAALLLQRDDNEPVDHCLIIGLWTLPATMMLAGVVCVPLGLLMLAAFAARMAWRLGQAEAHAHVGGATPVPGARAA